MSGKNRVKPETIEEFKKLFEEAESQKARELVIRTAINTTRYAGRRRRVVAERFLADIKGRSKAHVAMVAKVHGQLEAFKTYRKPKG